MLILNISETVRKGGGRVEEGRKEGRQAGRQAGKAKQGNGRQRGGRIRKNERYINIYIAAIVPEVNTDILGAQGTDKGNKTL